ncbi:hypothetical protein J0895_01180 [Phormidium pseudopriestleyi FRX01]|uniref:Uncharacterized protein n=1 Tax=Phormidium pseudopriestleyi FRX01 TaxID=1759528 RepID=A0ABS3FL29_9CYAN|nr:hypothetical protein [Phormidium pseudopriestleyi]MBO0347743.1 hypothetical protein [Phormidium pseudopriestleyi FRX01]
MSKILRQGAIARSLLFDGIAVRNPVSCPFASEVRIQNHRKSLTPSKFPSPVGLAFLLIFFRL